MFNAIFKFFAAIPENANLRLLLSESRLERAALQTTIQQRDSEITELKKTVELVKQELQDCTKKLQDCKKKLTEPSHNSGPLEPPWSEP